MTAPTVHENLKAMLADAIALKRPFSEVTEIKRQLAAYEPQTAEMIRAKQIKWIVMQATDLAAGPFCICICPPQI